MISAIKVILKDQLLNSYRSIKLTSQVAKAAKKPSFLSTGKDKQCQRFHEIL